MRLVFCVCLGAVACLIPGCISPETQQVISGAAGAAANVVAPGSGGIVDALLYGAMGYAFGRTGESGAKFCIDKLKGKEVV